MSLQIKKGKMVVIPEEPLVHGPKSSVQTAIDLHKKEVDILADEEIYFFDDCVTLRTIQHLSIFKMKRYYAKIMRDEKLVFQSTKA